MSGNEDLVRRREKVVAPGVGSLNRLAVHSARGAVLVDMDGREVLDFAAGIGVNSVGHSHPEVVEAAGDQLRKLQHTCIHVATYEPYVELCEKLVELFPHGDSTRAMLVNSGAEAVENAVKIARQATGRAAVLTYTEAFHGRTLLGLSLTSKTKLKARMGPYAPEIYRLPYPNHYKYGGGLSVEDFVDRELWRLREALVNTVAAKDVAAILLEVIQGEGGFVPCPPAYLRGLREVCDEHGMLLILDEVQSGFCRTGRWAAYQHTGVTPDLSTWAKAMGGGLPISAVVGKAAVMEAAAPGTLGGTYGGNPVAAAAALAAIRVMEREGLADRARALGKTMLERLQALQKRTPAIGQVRGMGAMVAFELVEGGDPHRPDTALAGEVCRRALEAGVLLISCGPHGNAIRLLPPLVMSDAELARGLDVIEAALQAALA